MQAYEPAPASLRLDPLTGVGDQYSFYEWILSTRELYPNEPFTVIALDLNQLKAVNLEHGLARGDQVLRWVAQVLVEETDALVYRIGGDEFVAVLEGAYLDERMALAEHLSDRLDQEGAHLQLQPPAAKIALIHFTDGFEASGGNVVDDIYIALAELKAQPSPSPRLFYGREVTSVGKAHRVIADLLRQLEQLLDKVEEMRDIAYTDPLTGLPNVRAAMEQLEIALMRARCGQTSLCILMIDGDDLRRYNEISYTAGDQMIRNLGQTQKGQLREDDFIARWRMGDEFLVILPDTPLQEAEIVGKRICTAVAEASQSWPLPVTVSVGISAYPEHGRTLSEMLYQAEQAKDRAKKQGKNRVAVAAE